MILGRAAARALGELAGVGGSELAEPGVMVERRLMEPAGRVAVGAAHATDDRIANAITITECSECFIGLPTHVRSLECALSLPRDSGAGNLPADASQNPKTGALRAHTKNSA